MARWSNRRSAVISTSLIAMSLFFVGVAYAGQQLDPEISAIVAGVDAARIAASIAQLEGFYTRHSCSVDAPEGQGINAARDWIAGRFNAIGGLQVRLDPYTNPYCPSAATYNVIAWIPGSGHPDRLIIVGGHSDSRSVNLGDPYAFAPGANDSGSQTAVVLEVARVMAARSYDATVLFVAFAGEEEGLIGSASLAAGFRTYFPNGQPEAMLNCDIVGGDTEVNDQTTLQQFRLFSPGTPRELSGDPDGTTDDTSPSRGVMRYIGYWGGGYVPAMTMLPQLREDRPGRGGDHESFIRQAYPGVRFIETVENLAHQHSSNDTSDFVTPAYAARIAQVVAATAASLARAPSAPGDISVTGNSAGPVTVNWTPPAPGGVDHYVLAARPTSENIYHTRVSVPGTATSQTISPTALGITPGDDFFISVAAVDSAGHESLFAYPEYRCDATECVIQPGSLDVTAPE